jgi:hypothetical protein
MTPEENKQLEAFKDELRALLKKYNASISCNIEGDLYGIDSNDMTVQIGKGHEHILTPECYLDPTNF